MNRSKKIVQVSLVGIAANVVLVALKAAVGMATDSIAVLLDAVNNLSDALSSVITIAGTKLAGKAPNKKHPYGYGRVENISSVTIAVLVLLAGVTSFKESLEKCIHPEAASYTAWSMVIIAAAVVVKFFLGRYVKRAGKKYNSESLVASGTDATFDSIISLSTLAAAAVSILWSVNVEGYLGVLIAIVIVKAGIEILMDSLNSIIGARVDSDLSKRMKKYINTFDAVRGAYDLVLHNYGPEKIIGSVHIEVDDTLTAKQVHNLTQKIMNAVYEEFGILMTVGIYASNTAGGADAEMRAAIVELITAYPAVLQIHGFYLDVEKKSATFDLVVDFRADAHAIRNELIEKLIKIYPDYHFGITIDADFSD